MANVVTEHDADAMQARGTPPPGAVRIVHYIHDTYGLGQFRRTLKIAGDLRHLWPQASQLIITGSPGAQRFRLPPGADFIHRTRPGGDLLAARLLERSRWLLDRTA